MSSIWTRGFDAMSKGILNVPGNRTSWLDGQCTGFNVVACSVDVAGYNIRILRAHEPFVDGALFSVVYLQSTTKYHFL